MSAQEQKRSTLAVHAETRRRFNRAKPFESVSADDFINELLDTWEDAN